MFSGWGGGKPAPKEETLGSLAMGGANPPDKPQQATTQSIHGFDPTALERAAKAAKELDRSANAQKALQTIMASEATKQKEHESERAKYQAMQQELAIRRIQEEEQSAQRTLEKQTQHERQRAEYKDQLERKRMVDQINAQRHLQEEERRKQEESLQRQEEIRRKTLEHEAALRQQTEMARIKAETEGRIEQERKNHDLIVEKKKLEAKEYRETVLEGIKLASSTIGEGLRDFITDKQKLANTAAVITVVAFGVYGARASTGVVGRYVESRLGKPSLIRDTSRVSALSVLKHPFSSAKKALQRGGVFGGSSGGGAGALKDIVLEPGLAQRLQRVAVTTFHTKQNRAPYRHLLLYGPPGTGKTLFAKALARESGMDYAIMTGGDVAPLGREAVTELHKLFDWATTSKRGLLIFIDEAEAFLRKRNTNLSEDLRNSLNAFLYRTGEASDRFMIVYATNQPEQLDFAINDRIDEMVGFQLPSYTERLQMIGLYMDKYLLGGEGAGSATEGFAGKKGVRITIADDVTSGVVEEMAAGTDGFSGREISKLAIAWQAAAYGSQNAFIDAGLMREVLVTMRASKEMKGRWGKGQGGDWGAEVEKMIKNSS